MSLTMGASEKLQAALYDPATMHAMGTCVFCQRIKRNDVERSWKDAVVFTPLNPVVFGHVLIVPRQHVRDAAEDPAVTALTFQAAAYEAQARWYESFNLITSAGIEATQSVFHLHVHLVPRRTDDGLKLPWTDQARG